MTPFVPKHEHTAESEEVSLAGVSVCNGGDGKKEGVSWSQQSRIWIISSKQMGSHYKFLSGFVQVKISTAGGIH